MAKLLEGSVIKKSTGDEVIATLTDLENVGGGGTAASTTMTDAGGFWESQDLEGFTQEVGQVLGGVRTSLASTAQTMLNA